MEHAHVHRPAHADPGLVIGLNDRIARKAVLEDLGIIDPPDLDIEAVGAGKADVAVLEGYVPGEEVDVFLGEGTECAVARDEADPIIDPTLGQEPPPCGTGDKEADHDPTLGF